MTTVSFQATTAVLQAIAFNAARKSILINNNSGSTVFISQKQTNVTSDGTPIVVGQNLSLVARDGDEPELPIYVQTLAGTADLRILEGFKEIK